jgi:hypothetical protein
MGSLNPAVDSSCAAAAVAAACVSSCYTSTLWLPSLLPPPDWLLQLPRLSRSSRLLPTPPSLLLLLLHALLLLLKGCRTKRVRWDSGQHSRSQWW